MAEWRFGRHWNDDELCERMAEMRSVGTNFEAADEATVLPDATDSSGRWRRYYTEAVIAVEPPGRPVPDGPFVRAWNAIAAYEFSDPGIVTAHFDPRDPLEGRTMLLEIHILGLHYLCGTRVTFVRDRQGPEGAEGQTEKGFRYDTLEGHFEVGSEWFLLTKDHATGEIWFRIKASWRPGLFPNWWSRLGFHLMSQRYQLAWHRLAYLRLRELVGPGKLTLKPVPHGRDLLHGGPPVQVADLWVLRAPVPAAVQVGVLGQNVPVQSQTLKKGKDEDNRHRERLG